METTRRSLRQILGCVSHRRDAPAVATVAGAPRSSDDRAQSPHPQPVQPTPVPQRPPWPCSTVSSSASVPRCCSISSYSMHAAKRTNDGLIRETPVVSSRSGVTPGHPSTASVDNPVRCLLAGGASPCQAWDFQPLHQKKAAAGPAAAGCAQACAQQGLIGRPRDRVGLHPRRRIDQPGKRC